MPRVEMLTMEETADEIGISRATLYRWRKRGRGPRVIEHESGTLRVRRPDLDAYLAERAGR